MEILLHLVNNGLSILSEEMMRIREKKKRFKLCLGISLGFTMYVFGITFPRPLLDTGPVIQ